MEKSLFYTSLPILFMAILSHISLHAQVDLDKGNLIYCPLDSSGQNKSVNRLPQTDFQFTQVSYSKGFDGAAFGAPFFYGNSYGRMERGLQSKHATFSLWFNTDAAQKESMLLGWDKKGYGMTMMMGGKIKVYVHIPNNQSYSYEHNQNLADGQWHNVIGSFNGQLFAVWIDGRNVYEDEHYGMDKSICYEAPGLNLGSLPKQADPKYYTGLLDEVLLYNRALSEQEIMILTQKGKVMADDDLENPIVYLPFEQGDLNTGPNLSNGTEITANGGTFAQNNCFNGGGKYMKNLDDGNGYLSAGTALEVPKFTCSFWMSTHSVKESFILGWDTTGYRLVLNPKGKTGKLQAHVWASKSEMLSLTAPETLNDGICHFIALSFDGQTARLYLDGNLKDEKKAESAKSVSTTTGVFHAASTFLIGREREQNPQMQYLGKIDEVRLYNRALANLEVKSLMAPTPPKPTYRLYETVGPNPTTTAFLVAHNPTEKEVTIIVSDTAGTKIAQEKIKPGKSLAPVRLTVKIDRKNLKVVWK